MQGQSENRAVRLARVIVQDIALYNIDRVAAAITTDGAALEEQIAEGRALFRTRIAPVHWHLYERAVKSLTGVGGPPIYETEGDAQRFADAVLDEAERTSGFELGVLDHQLARARRGYRTRVVSRWHRTFDRCVTRRADGWLASYRGGLA